MFYVYAHIDPRFMIPFYIGKGSGYRCNDFISRNTFYVKVLNKIRDEGLEPIVEIIKDNLTELEAMELEISEIERYGRRDLGTGCLTNLTNGGEGISGYLHSQETKLKISNSNKGLKRSLETRQKMSISKLGKRRSAEDRKKFGGDRKGKPLSKKHKEALRNARLKRSLKE